MNILTYFLVTLCNNISVILFGFFLIFEVIFRFQFFKASFLLLRSSWVCKTLLEGVLQEFELLKRLLAVDQICDFSFSAELPCDNWLKSPDCEEEEGSTISPSWIRLILGHLFNLRKISSVLLPFSQCIFCFYVLSKLSTMMIMNL